MKNNPCTGEDCERLNQVIRSIPDSLELAQACIDCFGVGHEFKEQLETQQKMATAAKAKFFPNES